MALNRVLFYLDDEEYAALMRKHMDGDDEFLPKSFNEYAKFALLSRLGKWTRPNPYVSKGKRVSGQRNKLS